MSANINSARYETDSHTARSASAGKLFLGSSMSPKAQELRARYEKLCLEIQKAKSGAPDRSLQP
jgi:hypothetical protein